MAFIKAITSGVSGGWQKWVQLAGLDPSAFSSLEDVLTYQNVLRILMTKHDSVDYLNTWLQKDSDSKTSCFGAQYFKKWLGLRDYAIGSLLTHFRSDLVTAENLGSIAPATVPRLWVDTAGYPWGQPIGVSSRNGFYRAFQPEGGSWNSSTASTTHSNEWIGFKFETAKTIVGCSFVNRATNMTEMTWHVQASSDGSTWVECGDVNHTIDDTSCVFVNNGSYLYYRVFISSQKFSASSYGGFIGSVQFYGWEGTPDLDEHNDRIWIYDHGVEVLPITLPNFPSSYGTVTKNEDSIELSDAANVSGTNILVQFDTTNPISIDSSLSNVVCKAGLNYFQDISGNMATINVNSTVPIRVNTTPALSQRVSPGSQYTEGALDSLAEGDYYVAVSVHLRGERYTLSELYLE